MFRNNSGRALSPGEAVCFDAQQAVAGIAPRGVRPAKEVEEEYGLPEGSLGTDASMAAFNESPQEWKVKFAHGLSEGSLGVNKHPLTRDSILAMERNYTINTFCLPKFAPDGKHVTMYFLPQDKPEDGWGDMPIGTIFAGGENGELLEVVGGWGCHVCYFADVCEAGGENLPDRPVCNSRKGKLHFTKLERTNDE